MEDFVGIMPEMGGMAMEDAMDPAMSMSAALGMTDPSVGEVTHDVIWVNNIYIQYPKSQDIECFFV